MRNQFMTNAFDIKKKGKSEDDGKSELSTRELIKGKETTKMWLYQQEKQLKYYIVGIEEKERWTDESYYVDKYQKDLSPYTFL